MENTNLSETISALLEGETNLVAGLANSAAVLKDAFNPLWVGFYLVNNQKEKNNLVLGPFQGPVACSRIFFGRGVCGKSWETGQTIIVGNVHEFHDHIACSHLSNSEIVVPIFKNNNVVAVLDLDSTEFNAFDKKDASELENICRIVSELFN
ncbi:MAG: GAF domain-containing protein [Salibacteraceae bacterium]